MMKSRTLGKTGLQVSEIGLGMEHIKTPNDIQAVIDRALTAGVNYIDVMIWQPLLQTALGEALSGRREKVILACHLSTGERNGQYRRTRDPQECADLINALLERLGTSFCDILHISNLNTRQDYRNIRKPGGVYDLALKLQQEGKARFIGMSGHNYDTMKKVIKDGILDVLMYPVRIHGNQPHTTDLLHRCARAGVGVVAMKTFSGGQNFQGSAPVPVFQCLAYSLAQPAVATVAMGVKNVEELELNLGYLEAAEADRDFSGALAALQTAEKGVCIYCNHCQPCTQGIDISLVNQFLAAARTAVTPALRRQFNRLEVKPSVCIECGDCMERCPFEVDVIANMRQAVSLFEG